MNTMVMTATVALLLLLSGCGKSHVNYSGSSRDSAPSSYDPQRPAKLPSGSGGYKKTGNPYKIAGRWYYPLASADGYNETGIASWYGTKFHGKKTANGERYDMHAMSAAHKTLPLPTMVRVTNLDNGRSAVVRVNDRGPFVKNRVIDLSYAAARTLGYDNAGTAPVRVEVLSNSMMAAATGNRPGNVTATSPRPVISTPGRAITTAGPAARHGAMYIQLGAFSSKINASRLKSELQGDYPNVAIYAKDGGYPEIFRVRIGPYDNEKNIETNVLSLQQQGYSNAIVVIE
ncbi:MAG: septal ring lytic transglycosylase RlpA family protein [Mariprofundaceae bacterium]|nr:septal ring lytic transglycosylase RlpA family protein [Mariprofundaceae bacterium]